MSNKDKTLNDIKSGKGLPPLQPKSGTNSTTSGVTKESRDGLHIERFTLNDHNSRKGEKQSD